MTEFKVGDLVTINGDINWIGNHRVIDGMTATISAIANENKVCWVEINGKREAVFIRSITLVNPPINKMKIGDTIINSDKSITCKIIFIDDNGALIERSDSYLGKEKRKWLNYKVLGGYTVVIPDAWVRVTYKDRHRNSFQIGSKTYLSAEEATKAGENLLLAGVVKLENYQQRAV